jgi:branched-chain amino acid transport system substrate-binding protein
MMRPQGGSAQYRRKPSLQLQIKRAIKNTAQSRETRYLGRDVVTKYAFVGLLAAAGAVAGLPTAGCAADVIKIGIIVPLTGPFFSTGQQIADAAKFYVQQHGDTVQGKKIELIIKDDGGNSEVTRRVAQEMLINDKVQILGGFGYTPAALVAAPISAATKTPEIIMGAATSILTEKSPYIVRTSYTLAQMAVPAAQFALKDEAHTAVTLVTDYGPGLDAESSFKQEFEAHGGQVLDSLHVPIRQADFAPFLQKAADLNPDVLFVFATADQGGAFVHQYTERGLSKTKIKLIATGDITNDEVINNLGDRIIGVTTVHHYSAWHPTDVNKAFVEGFKRANGGMRPNLMAVGGYDGMALIYRVLEKTGGDASGDAFIGAAKGMAWESPRGPIEIDPQTRDIVQNVYLRRVEKVDGEFYNVEVETISALKDPIKEGRKDK